MKKTIWLDCDTGSDDSFAIILANHHDKVHLLGISTVFGNNSLHYTTQNTLKITALTNKKVQVFKGASEPLLKKLDIEDGILCHGEEGLGKGVRLPETSWQAEELHAVQAMYQHFKDFYAQNQKKIYLCATGALTNVALLLRCYPQVQQWIEQLVIMGGGINMGNVTGNKHAEYNFFSDAEAASIVLHSNLEMVIHPINLTNTVLCDLNVQERLKSLNTGFSQVMHQIMITFAQAYKDLEGFNYPPLHDPTTIAYIIDESIFEGEYYFLDVEHKNESLYGKLLHSDQNKNQKKKVKVNLKIQNDKFWEIMFKALEDANQNYINN